MSIEVNLENVAEEHYLGVRAKVEPSQISEAIGRIFAQVVRHCASNDIAIIGPPFAMYHSWGDDSIDMECGFPVSPGSKGSGDVVYGVIPGSKAAVAMHIGPYDGLEATYEEVMAWMGAKGYRLSGPPWEVYLTDPEAEPDPERWMTRIICPVTE